jgi:hypothetical protein
MHENVNLVATGSMVAVLNISFKAGITVPSFFGGDGATFIIPPSLLSATVHALQKHRDNSEKSFGLHMRVGHVAVSDIYKSGRHLMVSKWRTSRLFITPIVLGDGLAYAETLVKSPDYAEALAEDTKNELDLSGMQCRWDTVEPPQDYDEVVSLLVVARDGEHQANAFRQVIDILDETYGGQEKRKPITIPKLRINATIRKLALEMRTKFGRYAPFYLAKSWMTGLIAPYFFKTKTGRKYLDQLVEMSDTLIIDGKINTVISGTSQQRNKLVAALDKLEQQGMICYGYHVSKESVLSCYVRNLDESHIHFVDGAQGGYTQAAGMLKRKMLGVKF